MSKITLSTLTNAKPGETFADPAVAGLRYRARTGGIFAEFRYKTGTPRKLRSAPLGRVDLDACKIVVTVNGKAMPSVNPHLFEAHLEQFRAKARELRRKVSKGEDPRAPAAAGDTLGLVVELFLRHVQKRPRTQVERERHLRRDWKPFAGRPLASLTRREIAAHVLSLKEVHGVTAANRSRSTLSALFQWAMGQGLVDANPVAGAGKAGEEGTRDRVLSLNELRAIWAATEGEGDYNAIVRLLMLTGQRREEVGGLRWAELELERALWSLAGTRTKNGKAHQVPLSPPALAILEALPRRLERSFVFGEGDGPFSGWSRCKRRLDARCGVAEWTLHDLRRSFVTHCAEALEIEPHVIEAAVNHISGHKGGVAGIYNRATYGPQKARALRLWAEYLLGAGEAQVVRLPLARGAA